MPTSASRKPGRPPAGKADDTRKRILLAAREVFSERGYDGATFQAIAVRADLTRPAINHYFASKRGLYREVADQTNELVIRFGAAQAERETTLIGRLAVFIRFVMRSDFENPSGAAFLITTVLESQRHPELSRTENEAVRIAREFLGRAVKDAVEHDELAFGTDVNSLVETLLVLLCGVGFYAGYVRSLEETEAITDTLRQLLAGQLWRPKN
jgi:TetR/AcrR family transcriptional regulator, repressor for uid operon